MTPDDVGPSWDGRNRPYQRRARRILDELRLHPLASFALTESDKANGDAQLTAGLEAGNISEAEYAEAVGRLYDREPRLTGLGDGRAR